MGRRVWFQFQRDSVCAWQTCQAGASRSQRQQLWIRLDLSLSWYFRRSVFSMCFWFSIKQISHDPASIPWGPVGHQTACLLPVFSALGLHSIWKKKCNQGLCSLPKPWRYESLLEWDKVQYGSKFASHAPGLPRHPVQLLFIRKIRERLLNKSTGGGWGPHPTHTHFFMWSNSLKKSVFLLAFPSFPSGFLMRSC